MYIVIYFNTIIFVFPYYKKKIFRYKYVQDSVDDVERILEKDATTTYNELIGRQQTLYNMVEFQYPDEPKWGRSIGRTKLFDATYIPTFVFSGYGNFFIAGDVGTFTKVVVFLKDEILTFEVNFYIIGYYII